MDPYLQWLEIPRHLRPGVQLPPHHYDLLAIEIFSSNWTLIRSQADRRMGSVKENELGPHSADSQKLLRELAMARKVLLDPERKAKYDRELSLALCLPEPDGITSQELDIEAESLFPEMETSIEELDLLLPSRRKSRKSKSQTKPVKSSITLSVVTNPDSMRIGGLVIAAILLLGLIAWSATSLLRSRSVDDSSDSQLAENESSHVKKQIEPQLATTDSKEPISVRTPLGIAVVPFSAAEAKTLQNVLSSSLNVPVVQTNSIGMKFALIPPGNYVTGDGDGVHGVTLSQPIYVGMYEVTQAQYRRVMGTDPSGFKNPQNPVEGVSWNNAVAFCHKLNTLPEEKAAGFVCRLPTEAEWEYACRAGTETKYSFGNDDSQLKYSAWYDKNSNGRTHPVGQLQPNPWGLYDMHGNVREWCQDWRGDYPSGSVTDPTGPSRSDSRVYRGGYYNNGPERCPSAFRLWALPHDRSTSLGFRVVLVPKSLRKE